MIYLLGFVIFIIAFGLYKQKLKIDFLSFLQPTIPLSLGVFGVYCFCGKQGSGKTYSLNKFIRKHAKGKTIYSNVTLIGLDYIPIRSMTHLLSLRDKKNVYIIYDEILNFLNDKTIPRDLRDDLLEFLSQQRKMENILLTTTQEWLNVPIEFRRFVRIQIDCRTRPLPVLGGILTEEYYDATQMKWDNLENEYIAPIITKKISKYEKRFMETYDTFERVRKLPKIHADDDLSAQSSPARKSPLTSKKIRVF